jgi:hypothetical protein
MLLDVLPYSKGPGRLPYKWGWLRYAHFALSLGLVAALWFGFGYRVDPYNRLPDLYWLLVGNGLRYGGHRAGGHATLDYSSTRCLTRDVGNGKLPAEGGWATSECTTLRYPLRTNTPHLRETWNDADPHYHPD